VQVVPSWAESFGLVTLEALVRGVPVVATTAGGTPEIVRDGREGLLVPPGDPATLADRVDRLLASTELRRAMGEAGRERVERRFSLDRMVDATVDVYAGVLAGRPAGQRAGA
jgi:glycosyltransferase involved in cell wall biosynthesis